MWDRLSKHDHIPHRTVASPCNVINMSRIIAHGLGMGWDSIVCIAIGYGLDGPGIEPRWGAKMYRSFLQRLLYAVPS